MVGMERMTKMSINKEIPMKLKLIAVLCILALTTASSAAAVAGVVTPQLLKVQSINGYSYELQPSSNFVITVNPVRQGAVETYLQNADVDPQGQ